MNAKLAILLSRIACLFIVCLYLVHVGVLGVTFWSLTIGWNVRKKLLALKKFVNGLRILRIVIGSEYEKR